LATSNPAFAQNLFAGYGQVYGVPRSAVMTVQGTVGKTSLLLAVLSATAIWSWTAAAQGQLQWQVLPVAAIGALVLALVTIFKPTLAPWTAPVYAAFEGVVLGVISLMVEWGLKAKGHPMPGVALQAVSLTLGTLCVMLFVYGTGMIRVTDRLRAGIVSATGAVCLVYLVALVLGLFGVQVPFLREPSPIGIGIGLVIVGIAAFNLLLDFDQIERGARGGAPKYLEWYSAFGLMLTLVWLYLEILQLLRQIYGRGSND
jgi:uncharacterized YccA/Bax inhibitor family protein